MSATETSPNGRTPEHETTTVAVDKEHGNSQKRKASSPSLDDDKHSQSPKRTRLDVESKEDNTVAKALPPPKEPTTDRRESALQEEKRRGKRLFGGLLSTLSQTTSSSQQKRRQEIERRQQAKVHQQKAEDDKHREEKLAKLRTVRKMEQLKFDERVMQTKHSNMLATARFLETKSNPKIYYLPWDPTVEQEDVIKDQIRKAEDIINKEVLDFKRYKEQTMKVLGITAESPTLESEDTVGSKLDDEHLTDIPQSNPANRPPSHTGKVGHEKESDRADDVMIEEVEDTVIY